ncbi:unnamed protein product [Auanema sp. JU1783]|nr:unnamed protein product [Auanema sp. JU1783]
MAKSLNFDDLKLIFGKNDMYTSETVLQDKGNCEFRVKDANKSLVKQNMKLKMELGEARKENSRMANEIMNLRERVLSLENKLNSEKTTGDAKKQVEVSRKPVKPPALDPIKEELSHLNNGLVTPCKPKEANSWSMNENIDLEVTPKVEEITKELEERSFLYVSCRKRRSFRSKNPVGHPMASPESRSLSSHVAPLATPMFPADSQRYRRAASSKIKSLAEPKLNVKLRRPGKYDEYVSVFRYGMFRASPYLHRRR